MQIQYNITRIEEWCKSHNMPEGTLQLEHLTQATKLLQLKKASNIFTARALYAHLLVGDGGGHRNYLRRLLDAESVADSAHVHQLLCCRLRSA